MSPTRRSCRPVPPGSTSIRTLAPALQPFARYFIRVLERAGIKVTVTSTLRSMDSQRALYENYKRGCSRFPAAAPGKSRHNVGTAFDLHLDPPVYTEAGRLWERLGGRWGGHFKDPIHFDTG